MWRQIETWNQERTENTGGSSDIPPAAGDHYRRQSLQDIASSYGEDEERTDAEDRREADLDDWMLHGVRAPRTLAAPAPPKPRVKRTGVKPSDAREIEIKHKDPAVARQQAQDALQTTDGDKALGKDMLGTFAHAEGGGFRTVLQVGDEEALVFLPDGGLNEGTVDAFLFFHGTNAQFSGAEKHGGNENPARNAHIAQAITASGRNVIGIVPMRGPTPDWHTEARQKRDFKRLVDEVVKNVAGSLGNLKLTIGNVSVAGHSFGGTAVGHAGEGDDRVKDMTLQDATYGYTKYRESFAKVRDWFLTGQGPKVLRLISAAPKGTHDDVDSTRYKIEAKDGFNEASITQHIGELGLNLEAKITFDDSKQIDPTTTRPGGLKHEKTIEVKEVGTERRQGTILIFGWPRRFDHFQARNVTMAATVAAGTKADPTFGG